MELCCWDGRSSQPVMSQAGRAGHSLTLTQFPQSGNDPCPPAPDDGHLYDPHNIFRTTLDSLGADEVLDKDTKLLFSFCNTLHTVSYEHFGRPCKLTLISAGFISFDIYELCILLVLIMAQIPPQIPDLTKTFL